MSPSSPIALRGIGIWTHAASTMSEPVYPRTLRSESWASAAPVGPNADTLIARDRLAVDLAPADRPVEDVLERTRKRPRVLGRREQDRVGRADGGPQLRHGGIERLGVVVRVEVRQPIEPVVPHGRHACRRDRRGSAQHRGVLDPDRRLPETRRICTSAGGVSSGRPRAGVGPAAAPWSVRPVGAGAAAPASSNACAKRYRRRAIEAPTIGASSRAEYGVSSATRSMPWTLSFDRVRARRPRARRSRARRAPTGSSSGPMTTTPSGFARRFAIRAAASCRDADAHREIESRAYVDANQLRRRSCGVPIIGVEIDECVLDRRRFDDRTEPVQEVEQLGTDRRVRVPSGRHRDEVGAQHEGLVHEHPDAHPAAARLIARAAHELVADHDGLTVQRGVVPFLDCHEKRVGVDVQDRRAGRRGSGRTSPGSSGIRVHTSTATVTMLRSAAQGMPLPPVPRG